ncbi:cytosine/adenosine deaminase-related metal-dependent hydrolase [Methanocalculus alkaliphilus]|uniref:amidohydrolase family protein n=1 Tax=Methanocalculus alkaliphilus TaxID=768730 RepID=UPI00209E496C|nr:amidohydrolase family protein [Methanocalculus alkaliphilus]MCP1715226.1 cytosine/adenosine deaminase-related metal-dependent hydrolase [Methanocalculus alkaliphilus]
MESERSLEGLAFLEDDLEPRHVRIHLEEGSIRTIEETRTSPCRYILPALFNAHTHIGDTVAMDIPITGDLASIVAPPDGLKHRILRATDQGTLTTAMRSTMEYMERSGIAGFADFREGGPPGVSALKEAAVGLGIRPLILGRDGGEVHGDGLGISSVRDIRDYERQIDEARRNGKLIAIHAGERDHHDIEGALSCDPDLLIHCTHARERDLRECADRGIPIAICPRSNWVLGVTESPAAPPVERMIELGCTVFLGTDNAMFVQPDLWGEMAFLSVITSVPAREILRMGIAGSVLPGSGYRISEGQKSPIILIDAEQSNLRYSRDPHRTIVSRGGSDHPKRILF